MLWDEPTPMMAEEMTWVVETGAPRAVATKMTAAPEVSAANPCTGWRHRTFRPTVLMIRQPPAAVPSAMAAAHAATTQNGMGKDPPTGTTNPPATRAMVMRPMVFWASLPPWESAMEEAERTWKILNQRFSLPGAVLRKIQKVATMVRWPTTKPMMGERRRARPMSFRPAQWKSPNPCLAATAPTMPPMRAWDEEEGSPFHQVRRFQMMAPMSAAMTVSRSIFEGSTMPLPMVVATALLMKAPRKLRLAARKMAHGMLSAPVSTVVAMELAVSWKPLM